MKYDAFISYSHAADGKLAPALQSGLQRFSKAWYKAKALHVYRDQTDLSATPHLWENIENALKETRYLILMASSQSAKSKWVNKEAQWWLANKSVDNLIIVLTDGDIFWDDASNDFDKSKTNALPEALFGAFRMEPLFINFKELKTVSDLSLNNPVFMNKVVEIAAPIHNKSVSELNSLEVKEHRKTIRIRNSAVIVLLLLLGLSLTTSNYAFVQRNIAEVKGDSLAFQLNISDSLRVQEQERTKELKVSNDSLALQIQRTEEQRNLAESNRIVANKAEERAKVRANSLARRDRANDLVFKSLDLQEVDPTKALRVLERAYFLSSTRDIYDRINEIYYNSALYSHQIQLNGNCHDLQYIPQKDQYLAALGNNIVLMDSKGNVLKSFQSHTDMVNGIAVSNDASFFVSVSSDGTLIKWDLNEGTQVFKSKALGSKLYSVVISKDNLIATGGEKLAILWSQDSILRQLKGGMDNVLSLAFSKDGERLVTASSSSALFQGERHLSAKVWTVKGEEIFQLQHNEIVLTVSIDPLQEYYITGGGDGLLKMWDYETGELIQEMKGHEAYVYESTISKDGAYILSSDNNNGVIIWDNKGQMLRKMKGHLGNLQVIQLAFNTNNGFLTVGDQDKKGLFWELWPNEVIFRKKQNAVFSTALSASGRYALSYSWSEGISLFDIENDEEYSIQGENIYDLQFSGEEHFYIFNADNSVDFIEIGVGSYYHLDSCLLVEPIKGRKEVLVLKENGQVGIFDMNDKFTELFRLDKPSEVRAIAYHSYKKEIAVARGKGIGLYRPNGRLVSNFNNLFIDEIQGLALFPNRGEWICYGDDGLIKRIDGRGNLLSSFRIDRLDGVRLSPNENYLVLEQAIPYSSISLYSLDGVRIDQEQKGDLDDEFISSFSANGDFLLVANRSANPKSEIYIKRTIPDVFTILRKNKIATFSDAELGL